MLLRSPLLALLLACAGAVPTLPALSPPVPKPMTAQDLVLFDRVTDPRLSPDGKWVLYALRRTDLEANKGISSLWLLDLQTNAQPRQLTASGTDASSGRWSADGKSIYFLSNRGGSSQVWRLGLDGGEAVAATKLPLDVGSFVLSPDGKRIVFSLEVFPDAKTIEDSKKRLDEKAKPKASGQIYDRLFVRHWDIWMNGTRSQLFALPLDAEGLAAAGEPTLLTRGIDGDVPSKPFGEDTEYAFSPDSKTVYFNVRIAGKTEAWSTNFDVYRVPADGSATPQNLTSENQAWDAYPVPSPDGTKLYYLAMKRPKFEADRFGIMELDLASGKRRELAPGWDRSPQALRLSADGRTIYVNADDVGQNRIFALEVASGQVKALTGDGYVGGFAVGRDCLVHATSNLASPAQLYRAGLDGSKNTTLTRHNTERLQRLRMGAYEQFSFKGAKDETVYGFVVKPADFTAGKKYPVAFLIHGGPQGSFGNEFHYRWNPQTYAGAGFAVVFIDFHGSTGYGQKFTDAVSGDWGGAPLEDLKKGWAAALAKYDFLDADRAAALGASYGGYMINWIAGQWPEPWKALVNHDGVFDTRMMYYSTEELWCDEWDTGATQYEKPAAYEHHNPVNHVAKWKVPMLVIHGALDYRVPLEQGIAAYTAAQRVGVPSRFLYFPDENHWVLKPQNSLLWHETVEAWLKQWTGKR
ncbi:MAG: S9 family peptidase [Verrucomicrobia bacterium]|nr:S9 family peptidase [Verrucomicrobiota bacterium]